MKVASVSKTFLIMFDIVSPHAFAYSLIASSSFFDTFAEIVGIDNDRPLSTDIDR